MAGSPILPPKAALASACAVSLAFGMSLAAQVQGTVVNGTTGGPAAGTTLTLSSFLGGMRPVEETVSGPDGRFEFSKKLPPVPSQQPFAGAIRAEFDGIGYTEILRAESLGADVRITVYAASAADLPAPSVRVMILEPDAGQLRVHDGYQFVNSSSPPVTYSSEAGTLLFHLPPAAGGQVDVSGMGPARMPLQSTALPAGEPGLYRVDFPLKPGENRIDVSYTVPYESGTEFPVRSAYPGSMTRVGAPEGVEVSGPDITSLGQEPTTKASIYVLPDTPEVLLTVTGSGQMASPSATGQSEIHIAAAPIASELPWLAALSVLILGLGFFHLLNTSLQRRDRASRQQRG